MTQAELRRWRMKFGEGQLRKVETILIIVAATVIGILYLISTFR
jgi:hypothetical protein